MNILVFGGTRYFGKRLVELLLGQNHHVTLATRGQTPDSFGDRVQRRTVNRSDSQSVSALASLKHWDVVVDQICYSPNEAAISCAAFEGRIDRYIYTSTGSVYLTFGNRTEADFDPFHYPIRMGNGTDFDYGEGKRLAEAVFFQRANFPVAAMRIPIVLGTDDYTGRLEFHIDRIRDERPIVVPNLSAEISFIQSSEAARFLLWLVEGSMKGPINACSNGRITMKEVVEIIEKCFGKKAKITATGAEIDHNPFADENSRCLDTRLANELGFRFNSLENWFPQLVAEYRRKLS